ncbi:hypothetical protein [Chitinophaga lutea]|nr:hypothetical protein [Chitinophaga lutea]
MLLMAAACGQPATEKKNNAQDTLSPPPATAAAPTPSSSAPPADTVRITGDFNGDGVRDTAVSVLYEKAVEENTQDYYIVRFTGNGLPATTPLPGRQRLVNEGDLNGDGADELTLFGEPLHGCTYTMQTVFLQGAGWRQLTAPWLIPTACEFFGDEQLQQRIFLENGVLYHLLEDVNDENFKLIKQPLPLR